MKWRIPGTVLQIERENADGVEEVFSSMFLAGGMVLSQVSNITGLEPYTVQNWVKRGFLSPPQHKRYSMNQLCRILHINMLKSVLPLEQICGLLSYVNGKLDEESDDIIDDSRLYFLFVRLASRARELDDPAAWDQALEAALADYREPVPGARARIEKALRVMLTAWVAARLRRAAEAMLQEL
jgi:DNA-binding transcriptional MerR regulator